MSRRFVRNSFAVLLFPVSLALAAPASPAHWSVTGLPVKPLAPGAKFTVTVTAAIDPGWHIYALEEPDGGPIATEIGLAEGDPVKLLQVDESRPRMTSDVFFKQPTGLFENTASFTLHLAVPSHRHPADAAVLHIQLRYQSCNDKLCLPPRTDSVEVPIPVQ